MEDFIARQRKIYPLSNESARLLLQHTEEVHLAKGEQILTEGRRLDYVYFVKEGFARTYIVREGKDWTMWFTGPGGMLAGPSPGGAVLNAEVMEDSILLKMSARELDRLFEQSLELANWGRKLAEYYLAEYEHYFTHYSYADARVQYENLLQDYPDLIQKVPLKHLASYLQITPQSLSRIRAKK